MCRFPKPIGVSTIGAPVHFASEWVALTDDRWRGVLVSTNSYGLETRRLIIPPLHPTYTGSWFVDAPRYLQLYTGWDLT